MVLKLMAATGGGFCSGLGMYPNRKSYHQGCWSRGSSWRAASAIEGRSEAPMRGSPSQNYLQFWGFHGGVFQVQVFWVMMPCIAVVGYQLFRGLHREDLWNVGIISQHYIVSQTSLGALVHNSFLDFALSLCLSTTTYNQNDRWVTVCCAELRVNSPRNFQEL
jgi:hypothetical protein